MKGWFSRDAVRAMLIAFGRTVRRGRLGLEPPEHVQPARDDQAPPASCANTAHHAEMTLQALIGASPLAIVVVDLDPPIVRSWNTAAEAMFGWRADELIGRPVPAPPPGKEAEYVGYRTLVRQGQTFSMTLTERQRKDGSRVEVHLSAAPLRDAEGTVRQALLMFADATPLRRASLADARLAAVVRHSSEAVFTAALDGRIESWNPAAERLFGYRADEIVGQPIDTLCSPNQAAEHAMLWDALLRGESRQFETTRLARSGEPIDVILSVAPLRDDPAGTLIGISALALDIRERKRAEQALLRSESLLRGLYESTRLCLGVAELTEDGDILHLQDNAGTCRIFGVPPGGTVNKRASELGAAPATIALWLAQYHECLQRGEPVRFEYPQQHPSGRRWYGVTVAPLPYGPGERPRVSYVFDDITDRHSADLRVRQSAAQARLALDVAEIGTWSWDPAQDLLRADPRCRSLCGLPPALALHWDDLLARVHPSDAALLTEAVQAAHAPRGTGTYSQEVRFVHPDGEVRWVVMRGQMLLPLENDEETDPILLNTVFDITGRKAGEQALADSDRRKSEFIATLSHELRNPLAPLRNGVEVLRLAGDDKALRQRALTTMERQLAHMVRMIDDLLDVSRITRDQLELRRQPAALSKVIDAAVETSQPLIAAQRHALTVQVPDEPVVVHGDPTRLTQVVANLLNNAAKYTPPGGRLQLRLEADDDEARVIVCDDGIGIAPPLLPRVFDMFAQVDRDSAQSLGGLGIGLAISRRLVELHGGRLEAHSAGLGHGSRFVMALPRLARMPAAESRDTVDAVATQRRILVVDDNVDAALSLCELLGLYGHEARAVHDGPAALALATQWRPELVLLDIGMPGMDGYEVARRLTEQCQSQVPLLVAVTGWGQQSDRRRSAEAGFDDHLVKPVEPTALLRLIDSLPSASPLIQPPVHRPA